MDTFIPQLVERGYLILFAVVFMEAIGLPIPAALGLLIAGGACGRGTLNPVTTLATAVSAILTGDTLLFLLGRYTGWWLLGLLCRLSLNPEACILRSADSFYRRGRVLLLFAKFVPGINSLAPPVAGSMNMRFWQFIALDAVGGSFYIGTYFTVGYVFSDVLNSITSGYQRFGKVISVVLLVAVVLYIAYQIRARMKVRGLANIPRVEPLEASRMLYPAQGESDVAVYDVRSHGYYEPHATRILHSIRLEPNALHQYSPDFFKTKNAILYCTCIREATSVRIADELRAQGIHGVVIAGGLKAWKKAALPLEPVPQDEMVALPSFGAHRE